MSIRCKSPCFLLAILLAAGFCWGASPKLPTELEPALDLFNRGQLLEAYAVLNGLEGTHSTSKEFLFLKAMTKWKMMWLSTYNSADRQEVIGLLDNVDSICVPGLQQDAALQFYHAAAIGLRAQVAATDGDWWKTAKLGKRMKNHASKIVEKDPEFYPAYYLLGSYNYFADALPGYLKFLRVFVFLPGGDRKQGLKQLIEAYEKADITKGEAGKTLVIIYTYYEQNFDDGIKMSDNVLDQYAPSFDVGLYKGINLYYSKDFEGTISWFEKLRLQILDYSAKHAPDDSVVPIYRPMEREIRYWTARAKIQQQKWDEAREILLALAEPPVHQPYWLLRGVYLSLAQVDYNEKKDDSAEAWIEKVLKWTDVKEAHEKAKKLKKRKGRVAMFEIDFL